MVLAGHSSHTEDLDIPDGDGDLHSVARQPRLRRLSPIEIDAIVSNHRDGATVRQLMAEFGVSRTTIKKHLRDARNSEDA